LFFFKFGWRRFGMIGQNIIRLHNFQIQNIEFEVFFQIKNIGLKIVMHSGGGCWRFCMNFKDSRISRIQGFEDFKDSGQLGS